MFRYTATIVCAILGTLPSINFEAENDKAAVDKARVLAVPHNVTEGADGKVSITPLAAPTPFHIVPLEGGDYTVTVMCLDPYPTMVWDAKDNDHKPGTRVSSSVVSVYQVTHEPHEAVLESVIAKREELAAAAAKAEERAAIKAEVLAEIAAEQAAAGKTVKS